MNDDSQLWKVVEEWQRLRKAGQDPSVESLCRETPELVNQVREYLEVLRRTEWLETPDQGAVRNATNVSRRDPSSVAVDASNLTVDQYQLLELLGQGGMGVVYKARHTKLDKLVAIKLMRGDFPQTPQAIARFEREMKAVGRIDHPNIVRAMDAGESSGKPYLVMELIEGTDLTKLVRERGRLRLREACHVIREAAIGLHAAHCAGLIHRDMKPSNLLLTTNGRIKILDLGLARLADEGAVSESLTASGQVLGTPDYMAPEQWDDMHAVDARTDLYALGCTLYFLLTGQAPYGSVEFGSVIKKMKAHVQAPIPDLHLPRADVPEALVSIYRRLMAKLPEERFGSAEELALALIPFTLPAGDQASKASKAPSKSSGKGDHIETRPKTASSGVQSSSRKKKAEAESSSSLLPLDRVQPRRMIFGIHRAAWITVAILATAMIAAGLIARRPESGANRQSANSIGSHSAAVTRTKLAEDVVSTNTDSDVEATQSIDEIVVAGEDTRWVGDDHVAWHILDPVKFTSEQGATLTKLPDRSLLLGGTNPMIDTFEIHARTTLSTITGIRLEALKDDSLPDSGPGRRPQDGNFILNQLIVEVAPIGMPQMAKTLPIIGASADFSQAPDFSVRNLLPNAPATGSRSWAVYVRSVGVRPAVAVFEVAPAVSSTKGQEIVIRLVHHSPQFNQCTLGRIRLSVTDGANPSSPQLDVDGAQRVAANWILAHQGAVDVALADGVEQKTMDAGKLPSAQFRLKAIEFMSQSGPPSFDAVDQRRFRPCTDVTSVQFLKPNDGSIALLDAFPQIEHVAFFEAGFTNAGLAPLARLNNIKFLSLTGCWGFSGEGLAAIRGLSQLRELWLNAAPVSDQGMPHLAELSQLRHLVLWSTGITDAGLIHLRNLQRLEHIQLGGYNPIQGHGLKWLSQLPKLNHVSVWGSPVNDEGMLILGQFESLRTLFAGKTRITDAGLLEFARNSKVTNLNLDMTEITSAGLATLDLMPGLRDLDLSETKVDDQAVVHLKKLVRLKRLSLKKTLVSDKGLADLKNSLAGCQIE